MGQRRAGAQLMSEVTDALLERIAAAQERLAAAAGERNQLHREANDLQRQHLEGARKADARMQAAFDIAFPKEVDDGGPEPG